METPEEPPKVEVAPMPASEPIVEKKAEETTPEPPKVEEKPVEPQVDSKAETATSTPQKFSIPVLTINNNDLSQSLGTNSKETITHLNLAPGNSEPEIVSPNKAFLSQDEKAALKEKALERIKMLKSRMRS